MSDDGSPGMLTLTGMPAAPGFASGRVLRLSASDRAVRKVGSPAQEEAELTAAIEAARCELEALSAEAEGEEAVGILAFQLALLEDEELTRPVLAAIAAGEAADGAWRAALNFRIADFAGSDNGYFRDRGADLADLRDRVLDRLAGLNAASIPPGTIVVADDLAPSRFLATDWQEGGLALARGSATSHVAILARAQGVPMLVGAGLERARSNGQALLDAERGELIIDPDETTRAEFQRRRSAAAARHAAAAAFLDRPAMTAAGERIQVLINVGAVDELDRLDPVHCDGIGLVRTEFLFHSRSLLPGEEEQLEACRRILAWAGGRPVTIRTLDAGADKPIPGLTLRSEANPFLGVRGVRLSLRHPEVFRVQIRALLRAAVNGNLKIMVPMVTRPEEMRECRETIELALAELSKERKPARRAPLGMMVEVPLAALEIDAFEADFFSIGSNDLMQYLTAASRDEPELGALARPSAAAFKLFGGIADYGRRTGREVSICGDLASDPGHIPALLQCGLRILSVAPAALGAVKGAIAGCGSAG